MQRRELLRESYRNTTGGPLLAWITPLLVFAIVAGWTAAAATSAVETEKHLADAGRYVLEVTAVSEDGLPSDVCQALVQQPSIEAAGGQFSAKESRVDVPHTRSTLPLAVVTPGTLEVWTPQHEGDTLLGHDLAQAKGLDSDDRFVIDVGGVAVHVDGALPAQVPVDALQSSITMTSVVDVPLSTCWVRFTPGALASAQAATAAAFAGVPSSTGPYDPTLASVASGRDQWDAFADTWPWIAGALVLLAVTVAMLTARRRDIGVYRLSGVRRRDLHRILMLQSIGPVAATAPLAWAWGATAAAVAGHSHLTASALVTSATYVACTLLTYIGGAVAAAAIAARASVFDMLREL